MSNHPKEGAKYQILVENIRREIHEGKYQTGDKLMSENQLSAQYGFSRQTVRQALGILEQEGVLIRRRGSGTYIARGGQTRKTRTIGVITTYITDYIFPTIVRGIEEELTSSGYHLSLGVTRNRVETEAQLLRSFIESGVDGLIVEGTKTALPNPNIDLYSKLQSMGVPCVFFNGYYREMPGSVYVVTDDRQAGFDAVRKLLGAGCLRLGGIFKSDDRQGHERYAGFARGIAEAGGMLNDDSVVWYSTGDKEELFSGAMASHVLRCLRNCDGVVCYNDQIAYGLIELLRGHGFHVPQEVSVVGFDNSSVSQYSPVKITTFDHPKDEMGRLAARKIIRMVEDGTKETSVVLPMPLVEKESVARLK